MDFTRGGRPNNTSHSSVPESAANTTTKNRFSKKNWTKGIGLAWIVLLVSVSILILALVAYVVSNSRATTGDAQYIQKDKYQAVFLTNGQVYFGKISRMNANSVVLQDIYYLAPTQTVQPTDNKQQQAPNYNLVGLGCELHGPQDQMVIERDQVTFWENLKDDGQVAKGIKQLLDQTGGKKCIPAGQNNQSDGEKKQQ